MMSKREASKALTSLLFKLPQAGGKPVSAFDAHSKLPLSIKGIVNLTGKTSASTFDPVTMTTVNGFNST